MRPSGGVCKILLLYLAILPACGRSAWMKSESTRGTNADTGRSADGTPNDSAPNDGAKSGATGGTKPDPGTAGNAPSPSAGQNTPATSGPLFLSAAVRRLTNAEFDHTVDDLFSITAAPAATFASDTRQSGFTVNIQQRIDATLVDQIRIAVEAIAADVAQKSLSTVVPCQVSDPNCPATFVAAFATKAFRRPLAQDELSGLMAVFHAAADGGSFSDGAQAVIRAVLQSASFLYIPELGPSPTGDGALDAFSTASALAYLVTGSPPDTELLAAAATDALRSSDAREAQARRLLATHPRAMQQMVRFLSEWLGLDGVTLIDHPADNFIALRPSIQGEAEAFIKQVLTQGDGTLATLLNAPYTMADSTLGQLYGLTPAPTSADFNMVSLAATPRRGLLSQAAFLSSRSDPENSSPVKRGAALRRQLLCLDLQRPTMGAVAAAAMKQPLPSASMTTRQRFSQHSTDPACSGCHGLIDPLGFAFEEFDQIGRFRDHENGLPIDATGELRGTDVDGPFANAAELMDRLSRSAQVNKCFARQAFRFAAARSQPAAEAAFLDLWAGLPAPKQQKLEEILVAIVRSDLFIQRSQMP